MTLPKTIWIEPARNTAAEDLLVRELRIQHITARLLVNRGFCDPTEADRFLRPQLANLHDPFGLPDMDKAARRIADAVQNRERIFIHGDYDVDGVTSAALYVRTLRSYNADLVYRVPHRKVDGYDLKTAAVEWAHEQGVKVIVTSDCGIQAVEAVKLANSLDMTVIITDHHEPGEDLPPAYAVVNPHRHDSTYPFRHLAGVGVAFKTMQAVVRLLQPDHEQRFIERFIDLVACGTVADVMPLVDENRIFASEGLKALAATRKVGLRMLLQGAGIDTTRPLTAHSVGFGIGPRINAVGRMDDAAIALDLLLTNDGEEAHKLVQTLNNFNIERKVIQDRIMQEARQILAGQDLADMRVLVVASPGWNAGVVGIVAGRLAEQFYKPTIVIGVNDTELRGKGSARSIPGYDLFDGIHSCRDILDSCGGHEMAAGLSLTMENLEAFIERINAHAAENLSDEDMIPKLAHDGVIDPQNVTMRLMDEWELLAPFGNGNPEPKFASLNMPVMRAGRLGKDFTHLKMEVGAPGAGLECVGWNFGDYADRIAPGATVDAVYMPQVHEWNGRRKVRLTLKDLRV